MASVTTLNLRDIRCFAGEQSGRLARITLLVGANGAGKSTFLGCYKTLTRLANLHKLDDENYFDEAPFEMGGFDTIARTGCDAFSLGAEFADHCHESLRFDFARANGSEPIEQKVRLGWNDDYMDISRRAAATESFLILNSRFSFALNRAYISYAQVSTWLARAVKYGHMPFNGDVASFRRSSRSVTEDDVIAFSRFISLLRSGLPLPVDEAFSVHALDPHLERRQRTYLLQPQLLPALDPEALAFLADLGKRLELWTDVRTKGEANGFAILVDSVAGTHNLMDVGFGVHSMLPLARAIYERPAHAMLLLQQPEVHLHPEAQANLAQFMVESQQGFLIETHSDHFLDRFRISVMRKQLSPDDLSILYFEPVNDGSASVIHHIAVDESGNLINVPRNFRSFFDREINALLGFED